MLSWLNSLQSLKKISQRWVWLILLFVGLLVFAGSLDNQFVWDDEEQIVNNSAVHALSNWPQFFAGSTFSTGGAASDMNGMYYKPLMSLVFALIYSVVGSSPWLFHLVQLVLHVVNAGLFYFLLQSLQPAHRQTVKLNWVSLGLSLIFLLHPINVETVVYISSLQDVLSLTFGLAVVLILLRKPAKLSWVSLAFFSLLGAVLAKETGLIWILFLPLVAQLIRWRVDQDWRILSWLLSGLSLLIYFFLRLGVAGVNFQGTGVSPMMRLNLGERLWSVPKIIVHYFSSYFWPDKLAIAEHWVVAGPNWASFYKPLILVIFLALIFMTIFVKSWRSLKSDNGQLAASNLLWMLLIGLSLGLHLQIFPLDMTVADRWFYVPQLGLLGLLSSGLLWLKKRWSALNNKSVRMGVISSFLLVLCLLSWRSLSRIQNWQNGLILFAHDVQLEPNSFDLTNNYGVELYRAGDDQTAKQYFERSTQLAPHWWTNWNNLGVLLEAEGDLESAEEYYQRAIDQGNYPLAYGNLARLKVRQDPMAAVPFIEESLKLLPYNSELYQWLAVAQYKLGDKQAALESLELSYRLLPLEKTARLYQLMEADQDLPF